LGLHVTWIDIAERLCAAVLLGALVGYDRSVRGEATGLRTSILLCLAACAAMIEANLMLVVDGKTSSSFTVLDALRFPLGILTGIGFIGAGAIIKRGEIITGVTTAASMWLVTVIGLVVGGGYIWFGLALSIIAFVVLTALKRLELRIPREQHARLTITLEESEPTAEALRSIIEAAGFRVAALAITYDARQNTVWDIAWRAAESAAVPPEFLKTLKNLPGVTRVDWQPIGAGGWPA
jgi:putative Mg2+ transporter-C (MgtC) family protein